MVKGLGPAVLIVLMLFAASCSGLKERPSGTAGIQHVVLIWLKNPGNAAERAAVIAAARKLEQIPLVQQLQIGVMVPSDRPVVDSTFDIGISMLFADQAEMAAYVLHPDHVRLVNEELKPRAARMLIYDFDLSN